MVAKVAADVPSRPESGHRRVVITHAHEDHAGAAAALRRWGDAEILADHANAAVIRGERTRADPNLTPADPLGQSKR